MSDADDTSPPAEPSTVASPDDHDALLRAYLAERDVPCPLCGYNLRTLSTQHCPECGKELELRVGLVEPNLGAYLVGVVGLAVTLGFPALLTVWGTYAMMTFVGGGPMFVEVVLLVVYTLFAAGLLAGWIMNRRRIRQMTPSLRWTLAGITLVLPLVMLVVVVNSIR